MFKRLLIWLGLAKEETPVTVIGKETVQPVAPAPVSEKDNRPWYTIAKKYLGKREEDPAFEKEMTPWWKKLYNRSIDGIRDSWRAWCGLFAGMCLFLAGYAVPKHGENAVNWRKDSAFVYLDYKKVGIPQGAFLGVNHQGKCDGASENHITMADGDCAPEDLAKQGATVNGLGGNQGNKVGVNSYCVHGGCQKTKPSTPNEAICTVGWPTKAPLPAPVTKSMACSGATSGSTR